MNLNLPKKIIAFLPGFFLLVGVISSPVFAQVTAPKTCNMYECGGDKGSCLSGVVNYCPVKGSTPEKPEGEKYKCQDGEWVPTDEEANTGTQGCTITIMGKTIDDTSSFSLKGFQLKLQKDATKGTYSRASWVGPVGLFAPEQPQTTFSAEEESQKGVNTDGGLMLDIINSATTIGLGSVLEDESGQTPKLGGTLGGLSYLITSLYTNPPASGIEYLADMGKNFGLTQPVYAQGYGFDRLQPLLPIWKVTRNLSYTLFVFIFLAVGFAIMFRIKISPQAVLTLESALPKIIIAMILINFSYAIIGFLIDLVYVLIAAVIAYLSSNQLLTGSLKDAQESFLVPSTRDLWHVFLTDGRTYAGAVGASIGGSVDIPILTKLPVIGKSIAGSVISFILTIALIFAFFKIFFTLLMSYVSIIIGFIISPFVIMFSALPGKEGNSLSKWFTDLLSNILVFPGVIGMFLLADAIKKVTQGTMNQKVWSPPYLFSANTELVGSLISFGLLMLAPKIPDYIKAMFDPKAKTPPVGATIMAPIGGAFGVAKAPISYPAGVIKEGYEKRAGDILGRLPGREVREKHGILDSLPIISDIREAGREWQNPGYFDALRNVGTASEQRKPEYQATIDRALGKKTPPTTPPPKDQGNQPSQQEQQTKAPQTEAPQSSSGEKKTT